VVTDVRGGDYFDELLAVLDELGEAGLEPTVVFLEADEETLVNRFKETRRRHPLAPDGRIVEGIRAEREVLGLLRERADVVMDTTGLTGAMLRRRVATDLLEPETTSRLALTLLTFGFKNGPPRDADLVFDVRFLPNPHFVARLRERTGRDRPVVQFLDRYEDTGVFRAKVTDLLQFLIPRYAREGKSYLTVAIGCTGGRHRSVAMAEALAKALRGLPGVRFRVRHRDVANA
jgi:UPF0042 nucleotide-binding protein